MKRYVETGAKTGSYYLYGELVRNRPTEGILSDPLLHFVFVGQSVYGAKLALIGGVIPLERADEFAARMMDCWAALLPSLDDNARQDKPAFALWVFGPILVEKADDAPRFHLTPAERRAWWLALRPLALTIVREGPSSEVNSLLRCLKGSPLIVGIGNPDIGGLFLALQERMNVLDPKSTGFYWLDSIECATFTIEALLTTTTNAQERDRFYAIVASWAAPPLANETASAAARRMRT